MELDYLTIRVTARVTRKITDPATLFAGRARFDAAFREACGCAADDCRGCRRAAGCPYPSNFAQSISCDPEAVRRHQKPPLPFVFSFPLLPEKVAAGCTCSLTLIGNATQSLGHYCAAMSLYLKGEGLSVERCEAVAQGGEPVPFSLDAADASVLPILNAADLAAPLPASRIPIRFLTPLKVLCDGRPLQRPDFSHLIRPLMRRVSALASYYAGCEFPFDYPWLSAQSLLVETDTADYRFVEWGKKVSGIIGSATFSGDLEPFHPLLLLGEVLHLGKNASFGQGQFRLEY